jgi:regulatory protein
MPAVRTPSLKGRALRYLSRREHSRIELRRKLASHAESPEQLERILDELESSRLLSDHRFAESVVHRRSPRAGLSVIRQELRAHGIRPELVAEQLAPLAHTELQRARAIWQRRFGDLVQAGRPDPRERARQMRFLLARGFSSEVVRSVVDRGERIPDTDDEPGA